MGSRHTAREHPLDRFFPEMNNPFINNNVTDKLYFNKILFRGKRFFQVLESHRESESGMFSIVDKYIPDLVIFALLSGESTRTAGNAAIKDILPSTPDPGSPLIFP